MSARVVAVAPRSPADEAGLAVGDELLRLNGVAPRDVLEYQRLVDEDDVAVQVDRGGLATGLTISKKPGEPVGLEVESALFDRVRTCDNHCEFCFIHMLPPGLRQSLYLRDDDYRLSFLYGNFTTLTRFTEADLERVVSEGLSPINVSIHATDPDVRAEMLRNPRGATSLRWLRALLDHGVQVHGQVVVCPGVNDGPVLADTMVGILDEYPELASVCVVPLGVSRYSSEARMRHHTLDEAEAVVDLVEDWQEVFLRWLGKPLVHVADEYYLLARRSFPPADRYGDFPMHEDGVGMARTFEAEFRGQAEEPVEAGSGRAGRGTARSGFFAWVDGAPADGYRAPRHPVGSAPSADGPIGVLTGEYGARVLEPLLAEMGRPDVRVISVENRFFGGNIAVTGLLVGEDVARVLAREPASHRYLLPDVCLSKGQFLDGTSPGDLPRSVEVLPTDGSALRAALGQ